MGSNILGAPLKIGTLSWGIFTRKILIKDLTIENPPGFEKSSLLNISQIVVQYDLAALLKANLHMPLVLVDLKELIVVKNKQGQLNVDALKILHPKEKKKIEIPPFMITELKLNAGQVIYKDYTKGTSPEVLVYDVDLKNKSFKNIDSVPKLATVVITQALGRTALREAGIYAAATFLGVGFLPAGVLGVIAASDHTSTEFSVDSRKLFDTSVRFIKEKGLLEKTDQTQGLISGKVQGAEVKIKLEKLSLWKTRMTVSARKHFFAQREFAGGIIYQISQLLK